MSNREQRIPPPVSEQAGRPSPQHSAGLSDELTAVLKLIATQNAKARDAENRTARTAEDENNPGRREDESADIMDHSAAIDRIQDEIGALSQRFADAGPDTAGFDELPRAASQCPDTDVAAALPDEEPWDIAAAEALTRVYETAAFGVAPKERLEAAAGHASVPAGQTATAARSADRTKRDWLEERFADIASKLESSLAEARDNDPVHRLDSRLEHLEARICQALEGLVTRSDIEHLRPADAQFETMANQFDRAAVQLSRLDTIEGNLETVLDRLSDERFSREGALSTNENVDLKAVAEATANNIVARLSEMGLGRVDSGELAEIRQSIDLMITERRRHDEQSVAILDTLQQAMISVIDRVDALAQSYDASTVGEFEGALPAYPDQFVDARSDSETSHDDGYGSAVSGEPTRQARPTPARTPDHTLGEAPAPAGPRYVSQSHAATDSFDQLSPETGLSAFEDVDDRKFRDADDDADLSGLSAVDRIRQELIADAKRARQQASEQASKSTMAGIVDKIQKTASARTKRSDAANRGADAVPPVAPKPASRSKKSAPTNGTLFGVQRRKLLVGAVIILFTTAGALMMMRATKPDAPKAPAASIEQNLDAAPASAPEAPAHGQSDTLEPGHTPGSPAGAPEKTGELDTVPQEYDAPLADPMRPVASNLSGVTVQHSARVLRPDQIAQLGEKQAMAHFSEQLGEAAAHAVPAALFPTAGTDMGVVTSGSVANPAAPAPAVTARAPLNLPPATVGPMSLRLAAAKGDASAEFEVGARLAEGNGTKQDFKEATRWYQRSAAQGFAQAQYRLGTFYERGLGMPKDFARATVWYQRAAENGNIKAMHNLAVLSTGQDVGAPDYATAAKWFTAAAERGLADSQYNLAVLHENGLGTAKDLRLAYLYFSLAAQSGDQEAKRRLETLRPQLSADQIQAAEGMVQSWRRKPADRLANDARAAGEDWKSRAGGGYSG